ncbi:MAG: hypothetical protein IPI35_30740 [Deltaproteobacteria bacterium]|nr:hypothetical protein [Deltaproteobacteria bacterium]
MTDDPGVSNDLQLLLSHADSGEPTLPEGLPDSALTGATDDAGGEAGEEPQYLYDGSADPQSLPDQRWGVIAPEGARGDRLLDLIRPLMQRRAEQQGAEVKVYRLPPKMSAEQAIQWKRDQFNTRATFGLEVPAYQLLLGDLDELPLSVQQALCIDGYTGRLAFDQDDHYRAYAEKVLRWEDRPAAVESPDSLYFTVHDKTAATRAGYRELMRPGLAMAKEYRDRGKYPAERLEEHGDTIIPSPEELLRLVKRDHPTVLFSVSHGDGPPRGGWMSPEEQRHGQGAMSFGRDGKIRAEDVPDGAFLPGGVWFMLACYGAGTPEQSAYAHWLKNLQAAGQFRGQVEPVLAGIPRAGDRPFIAALPKRVLANPEGPLAFIGHIDLAWTYSFQELDGGVQSRIGRFLGVQRMLVKGDRVGVGLRDLVGGLNDLNEQLTSAYDQVARVGSGAALPNNLGHVWMARNDLAAWVLLGDPAARLPLRGTAQAPTKPEYNPFGFVPTPQTTGAPSLERVEAAIFTLLSGQGSAEGLAASLGVTGAQLNELAALYRAAGRAAVVPRL